MDWVSARSERERPREGPSVNVARATDETLGIATLAQACARGCAASLRGAGAGPDRGIGFVS
jgi:hypothetical protein